MQLHSTFTPIPIIRAVLCQTPFLWIFRKQPRHVGPHAIQAMYLRPFRSKTSMRTGRSQGFGCWNTKELFQLLEGCQWIGIFNTMSFCSWMGVNLKVIATFRCLITKKVDLIKFSFGQISQAISLVPASGKNIKWDLTTYWKGQIQVRKLLLHLLYHGLANAVGQVKLLKLISLFPAAIAANGR